METVRDLFAGLGILFVLVLFVACVMSSVQHETKIKELDNRVKVLEERKEPTNAR